MIVNQGRVSARGFGEGGWLDAALSAASKIAAANAAKRQEANARALQAAQQQAAIQQQAAMQQQVQASSGQRPESNTMLYVGIAAGILVLAGGAYFMLRKKTA